MNPSAAWKCGSCGCIMDDTQHRLWESGEEDVFALWQHVFDEPFHAACGCYEDDEETGETVCNCKFEPITPKRGKADAKA